MSDGVHKSEMAVYVEPLDVSTIYSAAWGELSVRINARQNVQMAYVSAIIAVSGGLGVAWATKSNEAKLVAFWFSVFLPYLGAVFTSWFCQHEMNIGKLIGFLTRLECDCGLVDRRVGWYTSPENNYIATKYWQSVTFAILQVCAGVPAIFVATKLVNESVAFGKLSQEQQRQLGGVFPIDLIPMVIWMCVSSFITLLSIGFLYFVYKRRRGFRDTAIQIYKDKGARVGR